MKEPNLHHLLYFWAAARSGSIAAAARRLGVGRPAVSEQIAALEATLGLPLFRRGAREVTPTSAGRALLVHADRIFAAVDDFVALAEELRDARRPRLRLGLASGLPRGWIAEWLDPAVADATRCRLACRVGEVDELVAELLLRRLDVAFVDGVPDHARAAGLEVRGIAREPLVVLGPPALRARARTLGDVPWVLPGRGSRLRAEVERRLAAAALCTTDVVECDDSGLAARLSAAGHGVVAVPRAAARGLCAAFGLEVLGDLDGAEIAWHALLPPGGLGRRGVRELLERAIRRDPLLEDGGAP